VSAPDDPRRVRMTMQDTIQTGLYWLDDDAAPTLDNGFGGWQDQPRDGRRSLAVFTGPDSWQLSLGVFLEAWGEGRDASITHLRNQWNVLQALWSIPGEGQEPKLAVLEGKALMLPAVEAPNRSWALTAVAPRIVQRGSAADGLGAGSSGGANPGELVRWAGTLTFTRITPQEVLRITQGPNAGRQPYIVQPGDTLAKIAKKRHVKVSQIRLSNGARIRDPKHVKLTPKEHLWIYPAEHVAPTKTAKGTSR
jgi:LysM repeat protein